jgi:hypothetical protein
MNEIMDNSIQSAVERYAKEYVEGFLEDDDAESLLENKDQFFEDMLESLLDEVAGALATVDVESLVNAVADAER